LGILLRDSRREDQAISVLRRAVELGDRRASLYLASTLRRLDRFQEARDVYEAAIAEGDGDVLMDYGNLLSDDLNLEAEAEVAYRAAIEFGEVLAYNNLGVLLEENGRLQESLEAYRMGAGAGDISAMDNYARLRQIVE
jgi:tetratricopeptide (TPR) repeat protein